MKLDDLRTKIFADGAELDGMLEMYRQPHIKGFTTNPTLMRKAGITDYRAFAQRGARGHSRPADLVRGVLRRVRRDGAAGARDRDLGRERLRQDPGDQHAARAGVRPDPSPVARRRQAQRHRAHDARAGARRRRRRSSGGAPSYVSVFAGRIADTGRDPVPLMAAAVEMLARRAERRADLGEPARAAERLPGRRDRLPHHHRDQRHPEEARRSSARTSTTTRSRR